MTPFKFIAFLRDHINCINDEMLSYVISWNLINRFLKRDSLILPVRVTNSFNGIANFQKNISYHNKIACHFDLMFYYDAHLQKWCKFKDRFGIGFDQPNINFSNCDKKLVQELQLLINLVKI